MTGDVLHKRRNVLGVLDDRSARIESEPTDLRASYGKGRSQFSAALIPTAAMADAASSSSDMPGRHSLPDVKEERYCQAIARGYSHADARRYAGYLTVRVMACVTDAQLERIAFLRRLAAEAAAVTTTAIVRKMANMVNVRISDIVTWKGNTLTIKDSDALPLDVLDGIAEIKQTKEGLQVKLYDRVSLLKNLGLYLGMFVERHEFSGPDGKPIETITKDTDPQKAAELYTALIKGETAA